MRRTLFIAGREIHATVWNRGFFAGVLMTPLLLAGILLLLPLLKQERAVELDGEIAWLDPAASFSSASNSGVVAAARDALGDSPRLTITALPPDADLETEKRTLLPGAGDGRRLALFVLRAGVGAPGVPGRDATEAEPYDLYIREDLDRRAVERLQDAAGEAIVAARLTARGLDPDEVRLWHRVEPPTAVAVTADGERPRPPSLGHWIPLAVVGLLMVSVMTGGQYLMTTTLEEKSNRVVEVLLAAVSPMELMAGKILGQMAVGFLILVLYSAMGLAALPRFAASTLLDGWLIVYLAIFYVIAYFVMASFMAAIGAAVNDLHEAQALMTPVFMVSLVPFLLWLPVARDPSSLFATVTSLLPPINSFVMLIRLTTATPPPAGQVWLSIAIGAVSVYASVWFAAKVFRIGLLVHGKPPDLATLWRWARMA